jgi:uncharacterized DUF497 family protein
MSTKSFEWDKAKDLEDRRQHGLSFHKAPHAFIDRKRVIAEDVEHSRDEPRLDRSRLDREGAGMLTGRFADRAG